MLGVFRDGRQLNASHVASLGEFAGRVSLDLYANSSGWFNPGQWFLLEVEGADGKVARQTLRLGAAPQPTAGRVNLARGKPASQSSTSQWSRAHDAGRARWMGSSTAGYSLPHQPTRPTPGGKWTWAAPTRHERSASVQPPGLLRRARTHGSGDVVGDDGRAWRTVYRHDGSAVRRPGRQAAEDLPGR
jgi:hypothetical protein